MSDITKLISRDHGIRSYMVIDLQYGSTGKGLLAGYLARRLRPDTVVTAWGTNAGHTYIDPDGNKYVHRMLANGVATDSVKNVLIGPGSCIDFDILLEEIKGLPKERQAFDLVIHPQACVILPVHLKAEKAMIKIGSTMKGNGAAMAHRILRDPDDSCTVATLEGEASKTILDFREALPENVRLFTCSTTYNHTMQKSELVQIEGAQGFSVAIYHGFYPYTTSRDVTPMQVMADCAVPLWMDPVVLGTLRTYPIRVANRFDDSGRKVGWSGPIYSDQRELDFEEIGVPVETTTVTKLPRRVFSFSYQQLEQSLRMCTPDYLFLNFCNYLPDDKANSLIEEIEHRASIVAGEFGHAGGARVILTGHGPADGDIKFKAQ